MDTSGERPLCSNILISRYTLEELDDQHAGVPFQHTDIALHDFDLIRYTSTLPGLYIAFSAWNLIPEKDKRYSIWAGRLTDKVANTQNLYRRSISPPGGLEMDSPIPDEDEEDAGQSSE